MAENTVKLIAKSPDAKPSRPSVRLTAFDAPVTTSTIITGYSNPKSITVSLKKGTEVTVRKFSQAGVLYIHNEMITPNEI